MNDMTFLKEGEYTTFRGKPLVRNQNVLCYGDMQTDACVLLLMVISNKKVTLVDGKEIEIPDKMMGQIYSTYCKLDAMKRMQKTFSANGLFEAFDYGIDYLERMNQKAKA